MTRCVVMISSVSAKTEMIDAVRKGFAKLDPNVVIIGADANEGCKGRQYVDDFIAMPLIDQIDVSKFIASLVAKGVTHIIPSRDGELSFYAMHHDQFARADICVMVATVSAIETCTDKYLFYQQLGGDFPVIQTSLTSQSDEGRWVAKERYGASSSGLLLDIPAESLLAESKQLSAPIYQPYIPGHEYSIDLYISNDGMCCGHVVRSRDVIVDGEAKVTTSRVRPHIGELAERVAQAAGLTGHCLVQVIEDVSGQLHIVEINPRFGGSSSLSVALGLDSFYWFALESMGEHLDQQLLQDYPANRTLNKFEKPHRISSDED